MNNDHNTVRPGQATGTTTITSEPEPDDSHHDSLGQIIRGGLDDIAEMLGKGHEAMRKKGYLGVCEAIDHEIALNRAIKRLECLEALCRAHRDQHVGEQDMPNARRE